MNNIFFMSLSNGGVTIVDADIAHELMKYKWSRAKSGHIQTHQWQWEGRRTAPLHRIVNITPEGMETDHKNRIPWDNRRCNLRSATESQNGANKAKRPNCSSTFIGVRFRKSRNKWESGIRIKGKKKFLGRFTSETDAALAYNKSALLEYGEFAMLNKIDFKEDK